MIRLAYRAALSLLLVGNAAGLADLVAHGHGMPSLLGAVALGYIGVAVLAYALGAAWHVGRAEACQLVHRGRRRPHGRRVVPGVVVAEQQAHAEAMATVIAEPAPAAPPPTMVYTAAVGGVVGRFDGRAVADAAPGVWTPPVGAPGWHAGAAASDLSEWRAYEYGGQR